MAVAKVILNGTTLIDTTQKTVSADKLLNGYTALKNDGTDITGEYVPSTAVLQTKSETYTPTTSQQTDSITPDVGYDGLDEVNITINAVATGTAGTPTATKGAVSSNSIAVTPSVTNTTGYITGGTINGTAVTVSASELVSGTLSITSSGTKDVTNYASASVASGSATTPATTITANPSISVNASGLITASVSASQSVTPTVSSGYVTSGTSGTISVSGSNTSQLTTQSAQTITPTTTNQTIASGKYLTGTQTIEGIVCTNLTAENIADGVTVKIGTATDDDSVASITGTHSGGGGGSNTNIYQFTFPPKDGYDFETVSNESLESVGLSINDLTPQSGKYITASIESNAGTYYYTDSNDDDSYSVSLGAMHGASTDVNIAQSGMWIPLIFDWASGQGTVRGNVVLSWFETNGYFSLIDGTWFQMTTANNARTMYNISFPNTITLTLIISNTN